MDITNKEFLDKLKTVVKASEVKQYAAQFGIEFGPTIWQDIAIALGQDYMLEDDWGLTVIIVLEWLVENDIELEDE